MVFDILTLKKSHNTLPSEINSPEEFERRLALVLSRSKFIDAKSYFIKVNAVTEDIANGIFNYFKTSLMIRILNQKVDCEYFTRYRKTLYAIVNGDMLISEYSGLGVYTKYDESTANHLVQIELLLTDTSALSSTTGFFGFMKFMMLHYKQDILLDKAAESADVTNYESLIHQYSHFPIPNMMKNEFALDTPVNSNIHNRFKFNISKVIGHTTHKNKIDIVVNASIDNKNFVAILCMDVDNPVTNLVVKLLNDTNTNVCVIRCKYRIVNSLAGVQCIKFDKGSWIIDDK